MLDANWEAAHATLHISLDMRQAERFSRMQGAMRPGSEQCIKYWSPGACPDKVQLQNLCQIDCQCCLSQCYSDMLVYQEPHVCDLSHLKFHAALLATSYPRSRQLPVPGNYGRGSPDPYCPLQRRTLASLVTSPSHGAFYKHNSA